MANPRVIAFDGIHNFRDYGGYSTRDGGRLRCGILWRSAQHQDASDADMTALPALGIATIIDLRGDDERAMHPCRRPAGFDASVLFAGGNTTGLAPHMQAAAGTIDAASARERMIRAYTGMPNRPALVATMRLYFAALANSADPSLVHCVAGKDRTGFAVALLHRLLGVEEEDVYADYLLTNTAGKIDERIAQGGASIRARYGSDLPDDAIRALMMVNPAFLDAAFATVGREHGTAENYAETVLGVTPDVRARLEANLVE